MANASEVRTTWERMDVADAIEDLMRRRMQKLESNEKQKMKRWWGRGEMQEVEVAVVEKEEEERA
jgi:hypothetical protein